MSLTIHVSLFRACAAPCSRQIIATSSVEFHGDDERASSHEQRLRQTIRDAFERCARRLAESFGHHQRECAADEANLARGDRRGVPIRGTESLVQTCQAPVATERQIHTLYGMTIRHRIHLRRLLHDRFRKRHLYELTRNEAGCLIGELQKLRELIQNSMAQNADMQQ
jgi:hypothetical protein